MDAEGRIYDRAGGHVHVLRDGCARTRNRVAAIVNAGHRRSSPATTIVDTAAASSNDVFPVTATAPFVVGGSITVPPTGSGPLLLAPQVLIGAGLLASGAGLGAAALGTRRRVPGAVKTRCRRARPLDGARLKVP